MYSKSTKYEVSIFNYSEDIDGVLKFQNGSRDSSLMGNFLHAYNVSIFNHSRDIEGVTKPPHWNDDPAPLTFWTQNHYATTKCQGLLLCQVSSHSNQGLSFCHANTVHTHIPRHPPTYTHTHTYTHHHDKLTATSALPCVVGTNNMLKTSTNTVKYP